MNGFAQRDAICFAIMMLFENIFSSRAGVRGCSRRISHVRGRGYSVCEIKMENVI